MKAVTVYVRLVILSILLLVHNVAVAQIGGDFQLTDKQGNSFDLKQLRGKVVLLFFGYTSCPDVCPQELSHLAWVFRQLEQNADQVRGVFVSVDPGRDSPDVLKEYVAYFSPGIIGVTGTLEQIDEVTRQYRAGFTLNVQQGENYSVDHSANLYVINAQGKLHAIVPYGLPAQHILNVVEKLIK